MKVLYLITARGGSKSVPGKNLRKVAGLSLVGFKARSALRSKYCTKLIISTDSLEIQEDARLYGVEVPFTRPAELATDTASSMDVISHAVDWIERETTDWYDAIMLLEPSSPLTRAIDYDNAVEMMVQHDANLVVGMRETTANSVFVGPMDGEGRITQIIAQMESLKGLRRQDVAQEYTMNGALYLFKWDFFKKHRTIYQDTEKSYGYLMDRHYSIEIDEMIDLEWVNYLVANGLVDLSNWN